MSGFVPAMMQIVQPEPEPESPREKQEREQQEKRDAESVGGIPRVNLWNEAIATLSQHLEAIRAISDVDADGWFPERSRNRDIQKHADAALRILKGRE